MTDTDEREDATASAPSAHSLTISRATIRVPLTWRANAPSKN